MHLRHMYVRMKVVLTTSHCLSKSFIITLFTHNNDKMATVINGDHCTDQQWIGCEVHFQSISYTIVEHYI